MAGHSQQPIDVLRKLAIVFVLLAGVLAMYQYADVSESPVQTVLLAVGFVILASFTIGELAEVVKLPHITGYLITGLVLGESVAQTVRKEVDWLAPYLWAPFDKGLLDHNLVGVGGELELLDTLALALICITAGGELKLDALRKGLGRITALLTAQTVTIFVGIIGLFVAMSGRVPFVPVFAGLEGLDLTAIIALGAVLASVSLATAPAATIAIINSTGAKGPLTSDVLPVVVLKDVIVVLAFSASTVVAMGLLPTAGAAATFSSALGVIAGSVVLGVVVGGLAGLYLRFINAELLLFIITMIFSATVMANDFTHRWDPNAHAELPLVFIAAGFVVSNFSSRGDHLIHEVERLSGPVYVLFFTMAGAKLHLDILVEVWDLAILLVVTRIAMLYIGVGFGAKISGAHISTRRFGWMGFVSQAGLALTLGAAIQKTFGPGVGENMNALILAGAALNEVIGPILLQMGLGLAGETNDTRVEEKLDDIPEEREQTEEQLSPWRREDVDPNLWGAPANTGSQALDTLADDLELELRSMVRDLDNGPIPAFEDNARKYVRGLRQDFLRFHRHLLTHADEPTDELHSHLRVEMAELAARWRDALLNRSAVLAMPGWSPRTLQTALDLRVSVLPEFINAPMPDDVLASRSESLWPRVRRTALRLRHRFAPKQRQVGVLALGRYHFQGNVAARMEGLAALIINAELHLANRTGALFEAIDRAADGLSAQLRGGDVDPKEAIIVLRATIEEDFQMALEEVSWIKEDATARATSIMAGAFRAFKHDLRIYDTTDLPPRKRRFAQVFNARTTGLTALTEGLDAARKTASGRYSALALAFEVIRLEVRVKEAVDEHGDRLARQIRGKGLKHLSRVMDGLEELLLHTKEELSKEERSGPELSTMLDTSTARVLKTLREAIDNSTQLRDWLAGDASDEPLLNAIISAAQGLTEHYDVPTALPIVGEWALPSPVPTTEVPFREVTVSFIEANITRDLVEVTRRLAVQVDGLVHALQNLESVLSFNLEFAKNELDEHAGRVPEETLELVREMVLGSWSRCNDTLEATARDAAPWPEQAGDDVRAAVIGELDDFRVQVLDGRVSALLQTLLRQVRVRGRFLSAENLSQLLSRTSRSVTHNLGRTLGEDRIATLRHQLGLRDVIEVAEPEAFAPPSALERLPAVYRRLFSEHALEAGDLLTGRELEVSQALTALRSDTPGVFRTVALVSMDGIAKRAMANALIRSLGYGRFRRHAPTQDVDAATVDSWFDGHEPGGVVVIDGLNRLFQGRPGGLAAIQRVLHRIVEDGGRTAFIVMAEPCAWEHVRSAVGLTDLFAAVVPLKRLDPMELELALTARHSMSGYHLRFDEGHDLAWQIADLLSRSSDPEERNRRTWFRTLHEASDGVVQDALRLWMASIEDIDETEGTVRLGEVRRPPLARLRRLPAPSLLTLRHVLVHGYTDADLHGSAFRMSSCDATRQLASLAHSGLLTRVEDGYEIPDHLKTSVHTVLRGRGWA